MHPWLPTRLRPPRVCPVSITRDDEAQRYVNLYMSWKRLGALPAGPALDAQVAREVDALKVCDAAANEYEAFYMQKMRKSRQHG